MLDISISISISISILCSNVLFICISPDPDFIELQQSFMEEHYKAFEECEENKLEYMDIFNLYNELIERHIEECLRKRIPGFSMKNFLQDISNHSELEGEVFDILAKDGRTPDLSISNSNNSKSC
ncbi:ADP-ribosylation factor-like protein 2-binding protein isoform X2 [Stegodyphus dumicola]|uniref:ADP-ribosylation factor-like protein 2-binding protein isoform X2 n=1 Tax=Stegodyphus dumicola TaxID=202533 RepID=UPI0015A98559|nr:ADP-ribosylation factor-like protein 2-binding protein isoform X2 [Stegodyphus dumicola]